MACADAGGHPWGDLSVNDHESLGLARRLEVSQQVRGFETN